MLLESSQCPKSALMKSKLPLESKKHNFELPIKCPINARTESDFKNSEFKSLRIKLLNT